MYGELSAEKDRFCSRLATIPGLHPKPSVGDWILLELDEPASVARKVNRRMEPGKVSVPRGVEGAVRVHVGRPRDNEQLFQTLREVMTPRRRAQ